MEMGTMMMAVIFLIAVRNVFLRSKRRRLENWQLDFYLLLVLAEEREPLAQMVVAHGKVIHSCRVNKAAIWSHQGHPVWSEGYEVRWDGGGKLCVWCIWCCRWYWCQIFFAVHLFHAWQGLFYVKVYCLAIWQVVRFNLRESCGIIKYDILHWVRLVSQMAFDNGKLG